MVRTDIDKSYERLAQMRSIILNRKRNALNDPSKEELILDRFVDRGDQLKEARQNINERFDELLRRAERYGKLDMCAVFERLVMLHLEHAVARSRKIIGEGDLHHFAVMSDKLVRDAATFGSIESIIKLVEGHDDALYDTLNKIRHLRNQISHGVKDMTTDGLSGEVIRDSLNNALEIFGIIKDD